MAKDKKKKDKKKKVVKNGMCRCCVCERKFELDTERRTTVSTSHGLMSIGNTQFDAWDCPICGAQNRLNKRYSKVREYE